MRRARKKYIDWITLVLYISLVLIGWLMIYASSYKGEVAGNFFDFSTQYGKQLIWIALSAVVFLFALIIDPRFWKTFAYPIYGMAILLLISVLIFGVEVKGSRSWFQIAGFSLQPAEFTKFATALAMASYLSYYKTNIRKSRHLLVSCAIFLLPAGLILLQPDAGSALVFSSFFLLLYREGLSPVYYIVFFTITALFISALVFEPAHVIAVLFIIVISVLVYQLKDKAAPYLAIGLLAMIVLAVIGFNMEIVLPVMIMLGLGFLIALFFHFKNRSFQLVGYSSVLLTIAIGFTLGADYVFNNVLKPHQQERINVWLQPQLSDPRGSLYNVLQSKTAIGSGGLLGKGFLEGTMTKFNYVPEQSTDFIFCTIGEEQGFLGALGIIFLFLFLLIRIVVIAERAKYRFDRVYAYSVCGILFFHFIINIGMTMGLVPIIGIPLPFISYGGSSLIFFSLMIAVLLKLDTNRYAV